MSCSFVSLAVGLSLATGLSVASAPGSMAVPGDEGLEQLDRRSQLRRETRCLPGTLARETRHGTRHVGAGRVCAPPRAVSARGAQGKRRSSLAFSRFCRKAGGDRPSAQLQ